MKEPLVMNITHSIPLMESTGSYMIVDDNANLKCFYIDCQISAFIYYINFIKIGDGHKIGQSGTRPVASTKYNLFCFSLVSENLFEINKKYQWRFVKVTTKIKAYRTAMVWMCLHQCIT